MKSFEDKASEKNSYSEGSSKKSHFRSKLAVFVITAAVWLLLDILSKAAVSKYSVGQLVAGPFAGIFEFRLAHNTGGAWSLFDDSTLILGCVSLIVCIVIIVYLFIISPASPKSMFFALGLVFAGGIGNAIDRFSLGYVVDFIRPVFIDFPIFNVADIGVTCGIVLFFILLLKESFISEKSVSKDSFRHADSYDEADGSECSDE